MGGAGSKCCGGGGSVPKDKNDKYLDEIEYESLGVPSIDDALAPAFDMLATVVNVNNAMVQTVETVKLVGAVLMGAMATELEIKESSVRFVVVKEDDAGEKFPVAEVIGGTGPETTVLKSEADYKKVTETAPALAAVEACSAQLLKLNDALKEASMVGVSVGPGNRLKYVAGDISADDAAAKKQLDDAKLAIQGFNNSYFTVKYQLVQMGMSGGIGAAISEMITEIKKIVSDIKPTLVVNYEKLQEGELDIKPDLGISHSKIANVCPKKLKKVLDAVFGEKFLTTGDPMSEGGLIGTLVDTAKQCAELMSKFNESKDALQELMSDPSGIVTKTTEAGFSQMQAMKMPGKVASNVKQAMTTPIILAGLFKTIKDVAGEIQAGLSGTAGAAADA